MKAQSLSFFLLHNIFLLRLVLCQELDEGLITENHTPDEVPTSFTSTKEFRVPLLKN